MMRKLADKQPTAAVLSQIKDSRKQAANTRSKLLEQNRQAKIDRNKKADIAQAKDLSGPSRTPQVRVSDKPREDAIGETQKPWTPPKENKPRVRVGQASGRGASDPVVTSIKEKPPMRKSNTVIDAFGWG